MKIFMPAFDLEEVVTLFFFLGFMGVMLSPFIISGSHGTSMSPALPSTYKIVFLEKAKVHVGDIVAYRSVWEGNILHRVLSKVDLREYGTWYWICGDNLYENDSNYGRLCEWVNESQVRGTLVSYINLGIPS